MENCCQEHNKKKERDANLVKQTQIRLNRIVGQINGISKMISENRYCGDVLNQIAAIENALKEVGYMILRDHLCTCVADDIKNDDFSSLEEAIEIVKKLK